MGDDVGRLIEVCFDDGGQWRPPSRIVWDKAVLTVGLLDLPSGRLVLVDPTYDLDDVSDDALLCARLGPGPHPFEAAVFKPHRLDGRRMRPQVAAVRIGTAGDEPWVPAWQRDGSPLGVVVDSGAIAAFDVVGRTRLPLPFEGEPGDTGWAGVVLDRGFHLTASTPGLGGMVVFQSSMGDGSYVPWVQRNADGSARCVVVDMGVVE